MGNVNVHSFRVRTVVNSNKENNNDNNNNVMIIFIIFIQDNHFSYTTGINMGPVKLIITVNNTKIYYRK